MAKIVRGQNNQTFIKLGQGMFYEPNAGHGLPHNPLKAIVAPRPIGWIGTKSKSGALNLAPYSFFNMISDNPPMVMFSSSGHKDSVAFIEQTGEFSASLVSDHLKEAMNATSVVAPRGMSEFTYAGLTSAECQLIDAPRVEQAYAALECVATDIRQLHDRHGQPMENYIVTGEIIGVHIDESVLTDGLIDITKTRPVSRLGYMDFATTDTVYQMFRPRWQE